MSMYPRYHMDIWYARYGTNGDFQNRKIWQFTETGSVAGITGNVCIEASFYDYPELAAGNTEAEPTRLVPPQAVRVSVSRKDPGNADGRSVRDSQTGPSGQAGGQDQTGVSPVQTADRMKAS